jgi:hypothetical protein
MGSGHFCGRNVIRLPTVLDQNYDINFGRAPFRWNSNVSIVLTALELNTNSAFSLGLRKIMKILDQVGQAQHHMNAYDFQPASQA